MSFWSQKPTQKTLPTRHETALIVAQEDVLVPRQSTDSQQQLCLASIASLVFMAVPPTKAPIRLPSWNKDARFPSFRFALLFTTRI